LIAEIMITHVAEYGMITVSKECFELKAQYKTQHDGGKDSPQKSRCKKNPQTRMSEGI